MWKQIISYLYSNPKDEECLQSNNLHNSILFEIDSTNKVNLKIIIKNKSAESADQFGLLLFLINEGYYIQSFLDIISNIATEDSKTAEFIKKALDIWSSKVTESGNYEYNSQGNDPLIRPTQFNVGK